MKKGDKLYGFNITSSREIAEIGAILHEGEHEKSGARFRYLEREDENKTFLISFKTVPEDSTGVFHIIEHSVLCGSDKYPVKEPFVDLLKGSLNTFLNAMTYPDKTVYPVASRNDKDFFNLVSVYLDAVFHPKMLKEKRIFMQEGWHYEAENGVLSESGVVLNEMRGAFSSPDEISSYHIKNMLYKGTPYEYDSGGEPSEITSLTYENFCAAHKKFYHPSNAEVILDGRVDLDSVLPLIDSVLSEYDRCESNFEIKDTEGACEEYHEIEYELDPDETPENKTRLTVGYRGHRFDEQEKGIALNLLFTALAASNDSPLKKKIIDTGLCEDMYLSTLDSMLRSAVFLDFKNVKDDRCEELYEEFERCVCEIVKEGIDRETLEAALNSLEFKTRERDFGTMPSGVIFALTMLEASLYGGDPVDTLTYEKTFSSLREKLATDYYERLLESVIINNPARATLKMLPSETLGERRERESEERLSRIASEMGAEKLNLIARESEELKIWQSREDGEEDLATIPRLTLADVSPTVERIPSEATDIMGVPVLYTDVATGGISYLSLFYDVTDLSERELFILHLLLTFYEEVRTKNYTALELQNYIRGNLGSFSTSLSRISTRTGEAKAYVKVSSSALTHKTKAVLTVIDEMLYGSDFGDTVLLHNIIRQRLLMDDEYYKSSGHSAAISRAAAYTSVEAAMEEYYSGYESHIELKRLDKDFESLFDGVRVELAELAKRIFVRERLTLTLSGSRDKELLSSIIKATPSGTRVKGSSPIKPLGVRREGIIAPVQAAFTATAAKLSYLGEKYRGSLLVARSIVSYGHLWSTVRVQGGAYGVGMITRTAMLGGIVGFYSYRDPSPARTLECFGTAGDALREIARSGEDLTASIIGAVGEALPLLSPKLRGLIASQRYLSETTYEDVERTVKEILETNAETLLELADILDKICEKGGAVIVASKEKLDTCKPIDILKI